MSSSWRRTVCDVDLLSPLLEALPLFVDRLRIFVISHSEKDRLPQLPVRGPLRKLDLDDDFRCHPMHRLVRTEAIGERRRSSLEPLESPLHVEQRLRVEPAAGVSHVAKRATLLE